LLGVLTPLGASAKGAQAWFPIGPFQLQPSEFAKVALVVTIAAVAERYRGDLDAYRLAVLLGLAGVPLTLVYIQPDLGTAMVIAVVMFTVLVVAGARARHVLVLALCALSAVVVVIRVGALRQYQVDRLTGFLDQSADGSRSSYNLQQSQVAIEHGGFTGRGLFHGTQTNLAYVPEQHTDFIFTAVGEELGFIGAAVLLGLFAIFLWRGLRIAMLSKDLFGTMLAAGVVAMLAFQMFINIGMTIGVSPITGIPLPFVSYGGSSMITKMIAIGFAVNSQLGRKA
jgi:rod shape determining protein RodA